MNVPTSEGGAPVRLPGSRWRTTPTAQPARGAADRVRRSQNQARITLRIALAFIAVAAVVAAVDDDRWFALHLFLAGGVLGAISGVSVMLTVTWASAPAPPEAAVWAQRICLALGAAGIGAGRRFDLGSWVVAPSGAAYLAALVLLAAIFATTARHGVERRYDPAVIAYLGALVAGIVGVSFGIAMAVGSIDVRLRAAHAALNLLGLVGLVIGGTLPFFASTVVRSRMGPHATRRRLIAADVWQIAAVGLAAVGLGTGTTALAVAGLSAYALGIAAALWLLPRPTIRQVRWAGPRQLGLWAGSSWWIVAVLATAIDVARDEPSVLVGRWMLVIVVGGFAQILWGSVAYLLPVLRGGGGEQLSIGFAATRSWLALGAANIAALALALEASTVATVAVGVWVLDTAVRAARVRLGARYTPAAKGDTT